MVGRPLVAMAVMVGAVLALGGRWAGSGALAQEACAVDAVDAALQEVRDQGTDVVVAFDALAGRGCLGGEQCQTPLCKEVTTLSKVEPDDRPALSLALFDQIDAAVQERPATPSVTTVQGRIADWRSVMSAIAVGEVEVAEATDAQGNGPALWEISGLTIFPGHADQIDLIETILATCGDDPASAACGRDFENAALLHTYVELQHRILSTLLETPRSRTLARLRILDKKWDNYFESGRSLLPWEVLANSILYERQLGGQTRGFVEPPNYQLLLLHPSMAAAISEEESDEVDPALVLELIGWYRWSWGGPDETEVEWPIGGSLALAWGGEGNDPGLGATVHLPRNWSVGAVVNDDGDFTFLLSVDLAKFVVDNRSLRPTLNDASTAPTQ